MDWLYPTYAWTLAAVPLAGWLYWRAARWRRAAWERFGDAALVQQLAATPQSSRRIVKGSLVGFALLLFAVSLMGPRFGTNMRTVEREGVDLVVALDVSTSMQAQDVAPSRLDRAKKELREMVGALTGDRVGLVLFAGDGFVQCPLTTDYGAFRLFLDVARPEQVPTAGTNFGAAVDAATQAFAAARPSSDTTEAPGDRRTRVLLIVSDGENHVGDVAGVQQQAERAGVTLFTAGVGTQEGARVPDVQDGTQVGFKRDRQGRVVQSQLDEATLTGLAERGAYFQIGSTSSALSDVPAALRQLDASSYAEKQFADYEEMYQWPLAVALVLLVVEVLIPVRTRTRRVLKTDMIPGVSLGARDRAPLSDGMGSS